ncbi:MAG TPA: hypothetical protein VHL60_06735 [Oxalicibacterium sp.]|nr:hypothetical protein [Oxalicibacterium sp.]
MGIPNNDKSRSHHLVEQLQHLEYEIRRSITVREDQEDAADRQQIDAARELGIAAEPESSKGDLLSLVQTQLRAAQAKSP